MASAPLATCKLCVDLAWLHSLVSAISLCLEVGHAAKPDKREISMIVFSLLLLFLQPPLCSPPHVVHFLTLVSDWPSYLTGSHVAQFLQAYASKFQLHQHIQFNTTVRVVLRDDADAGWNIHIVKEDKEEEVVHFDKVVLATGSDTLPVWPQMPGRNEFQGTVIHGQSYREYVILCVPQATKTQTKYEMVC